MEVSVDLGKITKGLRSNLRFAERAASYIYEDPEYSTVAAYYLNQHIQQEVQGQDLHTAIHSVDLAAEQGLLDVKFAKTVRKNREALEELIQATPEPQFEYFGLKTLYDRYLLRGESGKIIETPTTFFLRIAVSLANNLDEARELYQALCQFDYMPSSPTLFNAGTTHQQNSSCFLLDSPNDSIDSIYGKYLQMARLAKHAGGLGVSWSAVRSRNSKIRKTGKSNGIVPWLKILDTSVAAVDQQGRRKGAACVYLETWHADIEEFLDLKNNVGDEMLRTHHLNTANWIPDLFMKRVEANEDWSLFSPSVTANLTELWGEAFERAYEQAERDGLAQKILPARKLYAKMMRTLAETGNGWMCFKDASNRASNQTLRSGNVIHSSNLCTEILEVTSEDQTSVCTLGSINLANFVENGQINFDRLGEVTRLAVRALNVSVERNWYPVDEARNSHQYWRPIGLGMMGWADALFQLKLPFDSAEAKELAAKVAKTIYFYGMHESVDLAKKLGPCQAHEEEELWTSLGILHPTIYNVDLSTDELDWAGLEQDVRAYGVRNSLVIAIAPTASLGSIVGVTECVEPIVSNILKRETLSGEFIILNKYLVADLKQLGLWTPTIRDTIIGASGSIQGIKEIPVSVKKLYKTAWEIPQRVLIDLAAARQPYIDQSQSLNLFVESPTVGKLSSMYLYAWKSGLKTTYYLRSRAASQGLKTTVKAVDSAAVACSLENPESCESCQ